MYPALREPVACPSNKPGCCVAHYRFAECPVCASLATLREERDALLADKARLDWLERDHNAKVYPSQCFGDFGVLVMHEDGIGFAESGKVRDAIDAARAAHLGTEP
jgi:hypothetical protein